MSRHRIIVLTGLVLLAAYPIVMQRLDQTFYISFASRIMIYAIAASSLNLILGNGGMISFGHAAFLGAGAYTVAIMAVEGSNNAWISWPASIALSAVFALVIGAISLRTRGVYFIMITLAFAQMMYYIFVSLTAYGGDDGLSMPGRSDLGFGLNLKDDITWYYVCLIVMAAILYALFRLVHSRFGRVIEATRENEPRMEAVGFPTYRYKLICFVIAGAIAGLSGAMLANQNTFVSPNLMFWVKSGNLMIMVILGGVGYHYGGLIGAVIMLVLEEVISAYSIFWQIWVGIILLTVVLFAPQGIAGLFDRRLKVKGH